MMLMEKIKVLGLYDSGLGGYSIYDHIRKTYPNLNLVLYADQKNAPYGNKSDSQIIGYAHDAMSWFQEQGITNVLIACNTVSAVALSAIKNSFDSLNIYGIIDLTVSQVDENCVGVISTLATYKSKAYREALEGKGSLVTDKATVRLVELIETLQDVDAYLKLELKDFETTDALILACTHYPLVVDSIRKYYKGNIHDSRQPITSFLKDKLETSVKAQRRVVTTGNPQLMVQQIKKLFEIEEVVEGVD